MKIHQFITYLFITVFGGLQGGSSLSMANTLSDSSEDDWAQSDHGSENHLNKMLIRINVEKWEAAAKFLDENPSSTEFIIKASFYPNTREEYAYVLTRTEDGRYLQQYYLNDVLVEEEVYKPWSEILAELRQEFENS